MPHGSVYGIDFGTDTVRIYAQKKHRIIKERNLIAVREDGKVLAVGNQAFEMLEKNPPAIDVRSPVTDSVISDAERAGFILGKLLLRADAHPGKNPQLYFSVPLDLTRIEVRAYESSGILAGARAGGIFLVDQPICDSLGMGIPFHRTNGSMIVNMGASSTSLSVIAHGEIVLSQRLPYGGNTIDSAIVDLVRKKSGVAIGRRTASRIKDAMADAYPHEDARRLYGMDTITGVPQEVVVSSELVQEAVLQVLRPVAEEIRVLLTRLPHEITENIAKESIRLTGGSARILHIGDYISQLAETEVLLSERCDETAMLGLMELMTHKSLRKLARPVREKR